MSFQLDRLVLCAFALCVIPLPVFGQGTLTPPGPPSPTMATLGDIFDDADGPRIAIDQSDVPMTITVPGSYYLVENVAVSVTNQPGIHITTNGVSIDLNGYSLTGPGATNGAGDQDGIFSEANGTIVKNGWVSGFGRDGVRLPGDSIVRSVTASENGDDGIEVTFNSILIGCTATRNLDDGFRMEWSSRMENCIGNENGDKGMFCLGACVITASEFSHNQGASGFGHGMQTSQGCVVIDCTANNNTGAGIDAGFAGIVRSSRFANNAFDGIQSENGTLLDGNICSENGLDGISAPNNCYVINNLCVSNGQAGVHSLNFFNTVIDNTCLRNTTGLDVDNGRSYVSRNTLSSNTVDEAISGGAEASGDLANVEF